MKCLTFRLWYKSVLESSQLSAKYFLHSSSFLIKKIAHDEAGTDGNYDFWFSHFLRNMDCIKLLI